MGNMCGGAPSGTAGGKVPIPVALKTPNSNKNIPLQPVGAAHLRTTGADALEKKNDEPWRNLLLNKDVLVRSVHACVLTKFKSG